VTGETVLYITEGFTYAIEAADGTETNPALLRELLEATGQLDETFTHPDIYLQTFEEGDLLIWDNRSLIHRARHTTVPEPTVSFRINAHDDYPFFASSPPEATPPRAVGGQVPSRTHRWSAPAACGDRDGALDVQQAYSPSP
jgi:hypothetical protein